MLIKSYEILLMPFIWVFENVFKYYQHGLQDLEELI